MLEWMGLIGLSFLGLSPKVSTPSTVSNTLTVESIKALKIIPVGVMVDAQSVLSSVLVRGLEDGNQALRFKQWLVPFDDVIQALGLNVSNLENGQLELRSVGLVIRIRPEQLRTDEELGLVLSIEEIETLFYVPAQFDIAHDAIVFHPPWLKLSPTQGPDQLTPLSVVLSGLPEVYPTPLSFTALQQRTSITQDQDDLSAQGNLIGVGTLEKGSWYLRTDQPDLLRPKRWQLGEAQFFRKEETFDVAIGSQPTFWQSRQKGDYWGTTLIKRSGFSSLLPSSGGFEPSERRQTDQVIKTIVGEAEPGTLVRLTEGLGDKIIAEVLVDSSGIYRFEKISMAPQENREYHVLLYPHGILTAEPEIRKAHALTRVDQLSVGASAFIFSVGAYRKATDNFFGSLYDFQGGVGYRWGLTDTLTLGGGVVSHHYLLPLIELFYQPLGRWPFALGITALKEDDDVLYNAEMAVQFPNKFSFYFNSDPLSKRFQWIWSPLPGLSLSTRGESRTDRIFTGITFAKNTKNLGGVIRAEIDNKQRIRWNLAGYLKNYKLEQIGDDVNTSTTLSYNFSGRTNSDVGHSLFLHRETKDIKKQGHQLNRLGWHYQSPKKSWEGRDLWEVETGYGQGTYGRGIFATLSTGAFSGITLQLRYQNISIASDAASFLLEVSSNFKIRPKFDQGNKDFENLRGEGGIFIQPFIDKNNNGVYDQGETIYTEHADLLLILNNKPLNRSQVQVTSHGIYTQLPVGTYRLDLDPAAYPIDGTPAQSVYAVNVAAGGYTSILIPFTLSYTLVGTVQDRRGSPVNGARVEAVHAASGKKAWVVTNRAGVFFLDHLSPGSYQLFIDGQPAQPRAIEVHPDSESTQEVTLRKP